MKLTVGLLVDILEVSFGNTKDENISITFWSDPQPSSFITGVDIGLIEK